MARNGITIFLAFLFSFIAALIWIAVCVFGLALWYLQHRFGLLFLFLSVPCIYCVHLWGSLGYLVPNLNEFKEIIALLVGVMFGMFLKFVLSNTPMNAIIVMSLAFLWPFWYTNAGFQVERSNFKYNHIISILMVGYVGCMASIWINAKVAGLVFHILKVDGLDDTHYLAMGAIYSAIDPSYLVSIGSRASNILTWEYIITSSLCSFVALSLQPSKTLFTIISEAQMKFQMNITRGCMVGGFIAIWWKRSALEDPDYLRIAKLTYWICPFSLTLGFAGGVIDKFASVGGNVDTGIVAVFISTCIIILTKSPRQDMFKSVALFVEGTFFSRIGIALVDANLNLISQYGAKVMFVSLCLTLTSLFIRGLIFLTMQYMEIGGRGASYTVRDWKDLRAILLAGLNRGSTSLTIAALVFGKTERTVSVIYQSVILSCLAYNVVLGFLPLRLKSKTKVQQRLGRSLSLPTSRATSIAPRLPRSSSM